MAFHSKSQIPDSTKQSSGLRIIRHDFLTDELIYRYPIENLTSGSRVLVQQGQEAILCVDGAVKQVYARANTYEIETNDLYTPSVFNRETVTERASKMYEGGLITNAYILFVNKDKDISCRWGTPASITFYSEKYQTNLHLQARGSYTLVVNDSVKLYSRVLGQLKSFDAEGISRFIFSKIIQIITDTLAKAVQQENILFFELQSHTMRLAKSITARLKEEAIFEGYGLTLRGDVVITTLSLPDEDAELVQEADAEFRYMQLDMLRRSKEGEGDANYSRQTGMAEVDVMYAKGMAEAEIMKAKGAYYTQERRFDVLQAAAQNEGGANVGGGTNAMTAGIGFGVGAGLAQGFGVAMGHVAEEAFAPQAQNRNDVPASKCPSCGADVPENAKFCHACGVEMKKNTPAFCTQCGAANSPAAKFCGECGHKF